MPAEAEVMETEKVARISEDACVLRIWLASVQPVKLMATGGVAPFFSVSP